MEEATNSIVCNGCVVVAGRDENGHDIQSFCCKAENVLLHESASVHTLTQTIVVEKSFFWRKRIALELDLQQ